MMPSGRPAKRPGDVDDSLSALSHSPSGPKPKQARVERGPEDFSNVVKSKLQSYSRTGQACDRCKVRKIRCDALAEGCSHCTNGNLECYVTDRVTGRTERRGYLQQLEREKQAMVTHIRDLEKLLRSTGIETRPFEWSPFGPSLPPGVSFDAMGNAVQAPDTKDQPWSRCGSLWVKYHDPKTHAFAAGPSAGYSTGYSRSSLLETRPTEGYLGVLADNAPLSSIKGTKLSILGATIDIASFDAPDMDQPAPGTSAGPALYNKSLMAFLRSTLGVNPKLENVDLPSREDAFSYAEWYFLTVHPFMPLLHKPSFYKLLTRIYEEPGFKPTTCELVTAHMVFATIYFQYGVRNREQPDQLLHLNELSNKHYHWALGRFFDLATSNTITAVQALAMIAAHTRNFPKPGCSSVIANWALTRAIELNLHRGVKILGGDTNIDNEVSKRVWWATLGLAVTLNGRLGRPMPIALEEFDVEFPMAIPDEYITENGITDMSKIGQCNFQVGLTGYKVVPLYLEMFANIYSVRRDPTRYIDVVRGLEQGMQGIQNSLPDILNVDKCDPSSRVFALYTQAMCLEFYLCLRHPSVCMTDDAEFCAENTRICEHTASQLLGVASSLLAVKSLDTTWYQLSVYVAAIFTTLVAHWERRFETTATEISALRGEMKRWMHIVYEIAITLGPGARLSEEIASLIDRAVAMIEQDMNRKDDRLSNQQATSHHTAPQSNSQPAGLEQIKSQPAGRSTASNGFGSNNQQHNGAGDHTASYYDSSLTTSDTVPYATPVTYPNQATGSGSGPNGDGMPTGSQYDHGQYMFAGPAANGPPAGASQPPPASNPLVDFAQAAAQVEASQSGGDVAEWRQPQANMAAAAAAAAAAAQVHGDGGWQSWTAAMADNQTDGYANTLLTLGTARPVDENAAAGLADSVSASVSADMGMVGSSGTGAHLGQWPLLLFSGSNSNGTGT